MKTNPRHKRPTDSLLVRIGGWLEASATGWGIFALVIILLSFFVAEAMR